MRLITHSTHSVQAAQADRPLGKLKQRRKRTANSLSLAPTSGSCSIQKSLLTISARIESTRTFFVFWWPDARLPQGYWQWKPSQAFCLLPTPTRPPPSVTDVLLYAYPLLLSVRSADPLTNYK